MKLNKFLSYHSDDDNIIKLDITRKDEILKFYNQAYPENYFNLRILETDKYYAYMIDGKIASISGVHVYSDKYNIAVLGNITTHPDFRRKGLSTKVTSKLLAKLDLESMTICLNVKADNISAITTYEKLGFEKVHEYEEGFFKIK
jgi:predicted GNAT family acetyltransferase